MKAKFPPSPSLRKVAGIALKINTLRRESGIPTEPYTKLKPKILKALASGRLICPVCLSIRKSLKYARNDGGIFRFWTEPICRSCFRLLKANLERMGFKL